MESCEHTVAQELGRLQLDKLDSDWVNEIIENDFQHCQDLPILYEDVLEECSLSLILPNLRHQMSRWLELNNSTVERGEQNEDPSLVSRQSLGSSHSSESTVSAAHASKGSHFLSFLVQEKKVPIQNLLALLGYFICKGSTISSSKEERQFCFSAAKLYLTFICIPGSMAFRVYHQMLFTKTVQLIQLLVQATKFQKSSAPVTSKRSHQSQQSQQSQPTQDIEEEEVVPFSSEDIALIEKEMPKFLEALDLVAHHLSFKRYPNILKETIETVLPLVSLNKGRVSLQALEIVQNFCQPLHGDAAQTVHHVFVHILPFLTLDSNEKDRNSRNIIALKDASFDLVESFILKFGEAIYPLVQGLIKHVCVDVVDRAEYRLRTAQTALDLLHLIPAEHQQDTIRWFLLLAHVEQAFLRLFAMEILSLLVQNGRMDYITFAVIFSQCSDPSATVRAKALSILGDCIESKEKSMVEMFNVIFTENSEDPMGEEADQEELDILSLLQGEEPINDTPALLPKASAIMNLLRERAVEEKVYVRKNALQLLLSVAQRYSRYLNQDLLGLFGNSCRDIALLIRRHMAQMLTELVIEHPQNKDVQKIWVQSVLPLVLDGETRVQEKALEGVDHLILQTIVASDSSLGWELLDAIIEQGFDTYLSKAFEMWSREQRVPAQLLRILLSSTEERSRAALTLIAIAARHNKVENNIKKFAIEYLEKNLGSADQATVYCVQQVFKVIGASVTLMNKENLTAIRSLCSRFISSFRLETNLIPTACDMVIFCIQQEHKDENDARKEASLWATEVLLSCGEFLSNHLRKPETVSPEEEEQLARRICTLGSVALFCPQEINKRHVLLLQHAAFQPDESGVDAPIPFSQPQTQPTRKLPPRLQAASIISLGKLSVQHEETAKQLIPGLGRLLETTPHEAIRNNIVCILCDWVVRYSTAVDPVMPQVTACLRDPNPVVRKQTLVLLIHLLQEDYLKIRGTFFFRILQLTCDDDESLRELALFYISQRLLHRQPTIVQQHFIESIFHFNDYKGHPTYNKFALTDRESKLFSIAGPQYARRRFQIYQFMLQTLDDAARFQLTFRLTRDILHGVVEDVMSIQSASTEAVLKDALAVLSSDDIKLASLTAPTDDDPAEKEDIAQAIVQSTKKAIIAQVVKRNVIENIVPIVVALKRILATHKSKLMGDFMVFLRELMKDYKGEIQDILAEDRQLMAEIDFDLKRFEQQEKLDTTLKTASRTERSAPATDSRDTDCVQQRRNLQVRDNQDIGQSLEFPTKKNNRGQSNPLAVGGADTAEATDPSNEATVPEQEEGPIALANSETPIPEGDLLHSSNDKIETKQQESELSTPSVESANAAAASEEIPPSKERISNAPSAESPNDHIVENQQEEESLPALESSVAVAARKQMPPPRKAISKSRLLKPRIMSTPIRSVPVDEVSFNIRDADLSAIAHQSPTPKRRRNK